MEEKSDYQSYYQRNRQKCIDKSKKYYEAHRDYYLNYYRAYFKANKEKISEQHKAYREKKGPIQRKRKSLTGKPRGRPKKPETPNPEIPSVRQILEKIESEPAPTCSSSIIFIDKPIVVRFD